MTEEEIREQQEYEEALRRAEQARQDRRKSLPNILRQHAFNDTMNAGGFVVGFAGPLLHSSHTSLLNEAADEIDRLRARIAKLEKN